VGERPPSLSAQSAPPREVLLRNSQETINHQVLSELEAAHIADRTATETPDDVWSIDAEVSAEPRQTPTSRRQPQLGRHDCRQTPTKASHRRNRVDGHTPSPAPLIHQSKFGSALDRSSVERTFVTVDVEWEWQRLGWFRGIVDGLVVAQVRPVSGRDGAEPGWIVYLTGWSQALDGWHLTEFDAMSAAETSLLVGWVPAEQ
jgi:hypothetical protein